MERSTTPETVAGHRVVSLEEWRKEAQAGTAKSGVLLRRALTVRANPVAGVDRAVDIVIGHEAQDRYRDVIETAGYELGNYRRNPVVLWCHDYYELPVGKALSVQIEGPALVARDQFTSQEENPFGFSVYKLLVGGYLNAASVGVDPLEWTYDEELQGYRISRQELLEHSIVPVPANPEALARAKAAGINLRPLDDWARKSLDSIHGGALVVLPRASVEAAVKAMGFGSGLKLFELSAETVRAKVKAKSKGGEEASLSPEELAEIEAAAQLTAAESAAPAEATSDDPPVEAAPVEGSPEAQGAEAAEASVASTEGEPAAELILGEMRAAVDKVRAYVEEVRAVCEKIRAARVSDSEPSTPAADEQPIVLRLAEPAPSPLVRISEETLRDSVRSLGAELLRPLAEEITATTGRVFHDL